MVGCGKESVPSDDTTSAKKSAKKAPAADSDSDTASKDDSGDSSTAKDGGKSKKKNADDDFKIERKAKDYLTAQDVVFMYSFNESDAKAKAEKACNEKFKGNHEKQAACMTAAQKRFGADGYVFAQDDSGKWYWSTVKVKNGTISFVHRVPFEFGKEGDTTIELKITGKDEAKGAKGYIPSEVTFEVPNSYQIIQKDPDEGKLVFEAKMGLLGDAALKKKK